MNKNSIYENLAESVSSNPDTIYIKNDRKKILDKLGISNLDDSTDSLTNELLNSVIDNINNCEEYITWGCDDLIEQSNEEIIKEQINNKIIEKKDLMKQDIIKQDIIKQDIIKQDIVKQDIVKQDIIKQDNNNNDNDYDYDIFFSTKNNKKNRKEHLSAIILTTIALISGTYIGLLLGE